MRGYLFLSVEYRRPGHFVLPRHTAVLHVILRCDAVSRNTLPVIPHLMRNPEISAKAIPTRGTFLDPASLCGVTHTLDPASLCGVTRCTAVSRNTLPVIPHLMRNPEIPAKAIPARGTFLDPESLCGVTHTLDPASLCGVTRCTTRYPGIRANKCLAFPLWTPHRSAG